MFCDIGDALKQVSSGMHARWIWVPWAAMRDPQKQYMFGLWWLPAHAQAVSTTTGITEILTMEWFLGIIFSISALALEASQSTRTSVKPGLASSTALGGAEATLDAEGMQQVFFSILAHFLITETFK